MNDCVMIDNHIINVKGILNELYNKCNRPYYIDTYHAETSTFDDGVTLTFVVKDEPAFDNQWALGNVKVDVDIYTNSDVVFSINEYLDEDQLVKSIIDDIGYDNLDDSEIEGIKKKASEYIATHPYENQLEYEKELVIDEYSDELVEQHKYYMEHEGGFEYRYNFNIDPKDYIYDVNKIKTDINNELSLFPEISCDNVSYGIDSHNFYIGLALYFNDYEIVFLTYYPELKIYDYFYLNIIYKSFKSIKAILNNIYKQMSRYTLNELYKKYEEEIVLFYVYIRDIINKNEADSAKDILYKAIDNGKIYQEDKDELGIEREDNVIRAIWENMCDQDFISEKQQKYVELAKRSLQ